MISKRTAAVRRTKTLLQERRGERPTIAPPIVRRVSAPYNRFERYLVEAGLNVKPLVIIAVSVLLGVAAAAGCAAAASWYFVPLAFVAGAVWPLTLIEKRVSARARAFALDYPTVLLATSSSMKSGMTAYAALERSVELLRENSLVKREVQALLGRLRSGMSKDVAVRQFGIAIRQPDLDLFRSGFLLVLEHGGRFAPTLERLALVCKSRVMLIHAAQVSTATMRMTANVLLLMTPVILGVIAFRTDQFWDVLLHDPVASLLAAVGSTLILGSYAVLMKMSSFKP